MIESIAARTRPGLLEALLLVYARGCPLRRGKLRVVNALWRAATGADHRRLADLRCGHYRMFCNLEEMLQRQFYFFGTYFLETDLLDCWAKAAHSAQIVFDVGANAGIYALEAIAANPSAIVHAFEPTPEIADHLRGTACLNGLEGSLLVHQVAVLDETGYAVLRLCRGETGDNEDMNYVVRRSAAPDVHTVKTVRLDRFCEESGIWRIDLLKLDIQGQEPAALEGAGLLLSERRIGMIFMELNWSEEPDCPAARSISLLGDAGYCFAPPGPSLVFRPAGDWLRRHSDILARSPGFQGAAK